MAYLQHGGFLFLISLLLQNEKEESRNEWKGMKNHYQQPLAPQNMLCFHDAQIMLCLVSSTRWVTYMHTEMKQRWYDENRWYTKWTTHIHLPLVFSDFWSFHPAKPNTALYIKNHTSSVGEVLYDVISHYNNLFFQFLRYQENVIFQFCLYSPLNEKYTLHLAQRCTYIERSKYLYYM